MSKRIEYYLADSSESKVDVIIEKLKQYQEQGSYWDISDVLDNLSTFFKRDIVDIIDLLEDVKKDLQNNEED